MTDSGTERITAPDGATFDGYAVFPEGGRGPGILLLQEIFGVGAYLRAVADRLAELGYVVVMPDVFWRIEPGLALDHDEAGLQAAFGYMGRYAEIWDRGLADLDAAYDHLAAMPAVSGGVGLMGFCLGGRLAWHLAARHRCDAAVAYYPSGVTDALGEAAGISCPLLVHVGSEDPYLPAEAVEALRGAVAGRANIELQVHTGAGHAFDNHEAAMFHHPGAAAAAWEQTVTFLHRHLPV